MPPAPEGAVEGATGKQTTRKRQERQAQRRGTQQAGGATGGKRGTGEVAAVAGEITEHLIRYKLRGNRGPRP